MELTEALVKEWKWSIVGFLLGFMSISTWMTHQEHVLAAHHPEVENRSPASVTEAAPQVSSEGLSRTGVN